MCLSVFLIVFLIQYSVNSENVSNSEDVSFVDDYEVVNSIENGTLNPNDAWKDLLFKYRNGTKEKDETGGKVTGDFDHQFRHDLTNETYDDLLNDEGFVTDVRTFERNEKWDKLLSSRSGIDFYTEIGTTETIPITESPVRKESDNIALQTMLMDESNEENDEALAKGSSLTFVFDSTGSMYDELNQVKIGASQILAALKDHPNIPIHNYVLVPFNDPGVGPVTVTTDDKLFKQHLEAITVSGGGDCPEMSIAAIKKALEVSLPRSYIYVFTDASAKDHRLQNEVLQLIQRKEAKVDFIMTDNCGDLTEKSYQVYERIAETSSGQVYHLSKNEVKKVLEYVEVALQPDIVNLLSQHKPAPPNDKPDEHELMVDETLKQFTISVSGKNAGISLTNPNGKNVDGPPQLEPLLTLKNVKIINVKEPDPGPWKVMINSDSDYTVRSTGLSGVHFNHGFSTVETNTMMETNHRPLKGANCYILIQTSDLDKVHNLTTVDIVDLNGDIIDRFELTPVPGVEGAFRGGGFVPPPTFFYLGITGFGKDGFPIKRITTTAISPQLPEKPIIRMKPKTTGRIDNPGIIKCYVQSVVPFTVQWYKDGNFLGIQQNYSQTCEAALEIEKLTLQSEGNYTCRTTNVAGTAASTTYLAITGNSPAVKVSNRAVASTGETVYLDCQVESALPYTVSWSQFTAKNEHSGILHPVSKGTKLKNNTLVLPSVTPEDEGWYVCNAINKGGQSQGRVFLLVKNPLNVVVEPKTLTFANGDSARFACSASGKPLPRLEWRKDQRTITNLDPTIVTEEVNGKLHLVFDYLEKKHAGIYVCHGINAEESVSANVELIYTEAPAVTAKENNIMVKLGSSVILKCSAVGEPKPIIKWFKGDREIVPDSRFQVGTDGTLTIESTRSIDAGEYSCVGENDIGTDSDYIGLFVGSPPTFLQKPRDKKIEINHNGTVPCSAIGMPPSEIHWKKLGGGDLNPERMIVLPSGALRIIHMKVEDEGYYVCTAENVFGSVSNQVFIGVTGIEKPTPDKNIELTDVKVFSGNDIIIPCGIFIGNPPGIAKWYKNGIELTPNERIQINEHGNLMIQEATANDRGDYLCFVSNVAGNSSRPYQLIISESPKILKEHKKDLKGTKGGEITIPCPAEGYPPPTITWTKNGLALPTSSSIFQDETGSLIIRNLTTENAGTYVCTAMNAAGSASRATSVHIQVPPAISEDLHDKSLNVVEGHVVVLNCNVNAVPTPLIEWFKNDEPLLENEENVQAQPEVLRFVANIDDSGIYKCVATNDVGTASKEFNVTILVPPSMLDHHHEESVKARAGIPITLHCNVYGVPTPTVLWQRNGMYLTQNNSELTISDTGLLIIQNVTKESSGAYICEAENMAGIVQQIYYLQVNFPPRIIEELNVSLPIKLKEGEEYSLPCLVEGNPKPLVVWRKNGLPITSHQTDMIILGDNTLVFLQVTRETTGIYKCEATNDEGSTSQEYQIDVLVPPSMMPDSNATKLEVNEGESLILTCPTTSSFPASSIQWFKDGQPLSFLFQERSDEAQMKLSDDQRSITIVEVHPSDKGNYSCVASNSAGRTDATFFVDVLMTPHFEEFNHIAHRTILTGGEVVLNCSVSGNPQPKVTWRKGEAPINVHNAPGVQISLDKQHLIIPNGKIYHSGTYICAAANKVNTKEREFYVNVLEPPRINGPSQEDVDILKGDNLSLYCDGTGVPEPTVTWSKLEKTKKSLNVTSEYFIINNVDCEHDGVYICDVTNTAGTKTKYFNVTVLEPPIIEYYDVGDKIEVPVGGNFTLKCKAKGQPRPDITWLHNGHILNDNKIRVRRYVDVIYFGEIDVLKDGHTSLTLSNITEKNKGLYTVLASNKAGVMEKSFNVNVLVPPKFDEKASSSPFLTVVHPFPVVIKCPADGNPLPEMKWYKENEEIQENDNLIFEGQNLRIKVSNSSYSGNYSCTASNLAGNATKDFNVKIIEPPKVKEDMNSSHSLIAGDSLILNCSGFADGDPSYNWFHRSIPLSNSSRISFINDGQTLVITSLGIEDSGKYSCIITNAAGAVENNFVVHIHEPPVLSDQSPNDVSHKKIELYRPLHLSCLFRGHPLPNITWYKDGVLLNETERTKYIQPDGFILTVPKTGPEHAGDYKCVAENVAGVQEKIFKVDIIVTGEWTPWSEWSDCSVSCGVGEQSRQRSCNVGLQTLNPRLQVDKSNCKGDDLMKRKCLKDCQIDGGWSEWTNWTSCSATCGRSTRKRYRQCDNPIPKNGGKDCSGTDNEEELCDELPCPVNGQWSTWSAWSECSVSCGGGIMQRNRKCDSPEPKNGGEDCPGWGNEFAICNQRKCSGNGKWLPWSDWTPCSATCGKGHRKRTRKCKHSRKGKICKGENLQIDKCFVRSCDRNSFPTTANLHVKGKINGKTIDNHIDASITSLERERLVSANVKDMLKQQNKWFPYTPFLLSPVSWNTAYETDNADNGYSLTNGNFFSQSDIQFATGEGLIIKHNGEGVDADGAFQVEIEVAGEVPLVEPHASVVIKSIDQDFVQTSSNTLYSTMQNDVDIEGQKIPFSWNSSIYYDTEQGTMPYLVEKLSLKDISNVYDPDTRNITYAALSSIGKKYDNNKCPVGFMHDQQYMHCQDIDECEEELDDCGEEHFCENTFGSYKCLCPQGFTTSAKDNTCIDIDECSSPKTHDCSHLCHNTQGSFTCSCPKDYYLKADKKTCAEHSNSEEMYYDDGTDYEFSHNENNASFFEEYSHNLDKDDLLQKDATQLKRQSCPPGYFALDYECRDYNECEDDPLICDEDETCLNTEGHYQCLSTPCPNGFERMYPSKNCIRYCQNSTKVCEKGTQISEAVTFNAVTLRHTAPLQNILELDVTGEPGVNITRTKFKVLHPNSLFRIRGSFGRGSLYALQKLKINTLYRVKAEALTYNANEVLLYSTEFNIFVIVQ